MSTKQKKNIVCLKLMPTGLLTLKSQTTPKKKQNTKFFIKGNKTIQATISPIQIEHFEQRHAISVKWHYKKCQQTRDINRYQFSVNWTKKNNTQYCVNRIDDNYLICSSFQRLVPFLFLFSLCLPFCLSSLFRFRWRTICLYKCHR